MEANGNGNGNSNDNNSQSRLSLIESVKSLHPDKPWTWQSPSLYITFWSLSLYDIYVPKPRYEDEIKKIQLQITALDDSKDPQVYSYQ